MLFPQAFEQGQALCGNIQDHGIPGIIQLLVVTVKLQQPPQKASELIIAYSTSLIAFELIMVQILLFNEIRLYPTQTGKFPDSKLGIEVNNNASQVEY